MKKISEYQIGDELYRYVNMAGVFKYEVIGRREYSGEVQLEVEAKTCSHGWQCRLLLASDDKGRIVFVHMLNNGESEDQSYWHTNDGFHFWPTSEQAKQQKLDQLIAEAQNEISKAEEVLTYRKKRLAELKGINEGVQP